jgi:hypothetical protein
MVLTCNRIATVVWGQDLIPAQIPVAKAALQFSQTADAGASSAVAAVDGPLPFRFCAHCSSKARLTPSDPDSGNDARYSRSNDRCFFGLCGLKMDPNGAVLLEGRSLTRWSHNPTLFNRHRPPLVPHRHVYLTQNSSVEQFDVQSSAAGGQISMSP